MTTQLGSGNGFGWLDSDGKAVRMVVSYDTPAQVIARVGTWVGFTQAAADSGDYIALEIIPREYQLQVPSSLTLPVGTKLYLDVSDYDNWAGHRPPDAAYTTSAGSNLYLGKITRAKDSNNTVRLILLPGGQ